MARKTSPSVRGPKIFAMLLTEKASRRCVCSTALGIPVVPPLNNSAAGIVRPGVAQPNRSLGLGNEIPHRNVLSYADHARNPQLAGEFGHHVAIRRHAEYGARHRVPQKRSELNGRVERV